MAKKRARVLALGLATLLSSSAVSAQTIFDAVKANDLSRVKAIVEQDLSLVRARDTSGNTPLHTAAIVGSVPIAEWLLSKGADIDAENVEKLRPLVEAIRNGKDDLAKVLIDKGARIAGALQRAATSNRTAVMELLLAKGADLEERDGQGNTPLTFVTRTNGPFEALELLVRKGANINLKDSLGNTPLDNVVIYAADDNRSIDLLLAKSPEVTTAPRFLATILSVAAGRGHVRLFDYYVARGGEALFADEANRRAFMRSAIVGDSLEMVKKLQARNIPLDVSANISGLTPLHTLARNPKALDMIEFLARNGADVNARTKDGRSAYNIADAAGNRDACALLVKLGASREPQQFPRLVGPYLGQTPPGDDVQPFAPGIVAPLDHGTITVSPDGRELYWPTGTSIMMMRIQDGSWTQPTYAPFSGPSQIDFYDDVPFVTPDNKRLFFTSKRPVGSGTSQKENIWFVERRANGWSEPKPAGEAVNALGLHWQVSVSRAGTLYFGGQGDILCSRLVDGRYAAPVALGPAINTKDASESQPYVAPDESYLLFWRAPGQIPTAFVSFRGRDGEWRPAVKLDLPWRGGGLTVSPDGNYLFMGGSWRSATFLEEVRAKGEAPGQASGPAAKNDAGTDIVIGRSTTFKSTLLNRTITLDVALPAGYATGRDRPPFRTRILKGSHLAP